MAKISVDDVLAHAPAMLPADENEGDSSPKLQGLDSNPQGEFGLQVWQAFRDTFAHIYTVSLPDPSEEKRFTLSTRTYHTPRAILMRSQGTAFSMTRGPALVAQSPDQLLIYLELEGRCDNDWNGRRGSVESGDVQIVDYARPFHSVTTDYTNLIIILARESVPATLLAMEPHGLVFRRGSGAAHLIGAAMQSLYAKADDLTVSEAEAAIEGIVALTNAYARAWLASDETDHVKSRRKAALDYIDAHLANTRLGPSEIADAVHLSRASLYRLLAAEGGIRALLLQHRLDHALRLLLADKKDEQSLMDVARCCGFGGASQFSRAFRARFGLPPRQYRALVRQQDRDWQEARLRADGFDRGSLFWRHQNPAASKQSGTSE
ncbi:MAG TPA: AraC family transcriptional regulator [Pseudolabrys sp.]|nr:AraC family transcriptional regulator [Pseudolabrys sp.]